MRWRSFSCFLPQQMFLDFPERRARQRLDADEAPRHLERRELLAAAAGELALVGVADDERDRELAADRVGHADDRGLVDLRLLEEELLDLARIDVEAARDDEVALPPAQGDVAVVRALREVAGAEPAVDERGRRRLRLAPVRGEERRALDEELAAIAPRGGAGEREADGAGPPLADVRIADRHEGLGHAVALEDRVAEERAELLEDVRRQRRGAGDEEAHALGDLARGRPSRIEQPHVDGRHAEEERRPKVEELLRRGAVVEEERRPKVEE